MRVLFVHNYYGSGAPSGENQVFEAERALLESHGDEVATLVRNSDVLRSRGVIGLVVGAVGTPWNPLAASTVKRAVESFRPDVVHVHNTFPLLSPAIFSAIGSSAARVLTLHNYRLFCPAAIPMRGGAVCTECIDQRSVLPALRHGCYRESRLATLPLAASVSLHRRLGTWEHDVEAFISLSEFQKDRMVAAGLPRALVHVKPNFFPGNPAPIAWAERESSMVFVGRLTPEKGAMTLLAAWKAWGVDAPPLTIVGDGPQRAELEEYARAMAPGKVRFLGQVAREATLREIARARMVIVPSECFEGLPTVLIEAFAFGTPVAVSNLGPLPSLVRAGVDGVVFEPNAPQSLLESARAAWQAPGALEKLGSGARAEFEATYSEQANYAALLEIYAAAIDVSGKRRAEQGNERQAS